MRTINIKNHKLNIYDDIMEMPVVRYNKYQKYMVLAAGVGNDIPAVLQKISSMQQMVGNEKQVKKLNAEFVALKNALSFIDGGIDPSSLAFACLVHDIDGRECDVISEDSIESTSNEIAAITTKSELMMAISGIKKKSMRHSKRIFPTRTDNKATKKSMP